MADFHLTLRFADGSRQPLQTARILISVMDGRGRLLGTQQTAGDTITLAIPLSGDFITDRFTLNASAKGYRDVGYAGLRPDQSSLHLMMVERNARIVFRKPEEWPPAWSGLRGQLGDEFSSFGESAALPAACLLNILEAIRLFPGGMNLLSAMQDIPLVPGNEETRANRAEGILQDRALLFVEPEFKAALNDQLGHALQKVSAIAHGQPQAGETVASFKENRFPEANLQFTLFESEWRLYVDLDLDYFRDPLSHALLELFPNSVFQTRTDPRRVYALRWMGSKNGGAPADQEFAPPYVLAV